MVKFEPEVLVVPHLLHSLAIMSREGALWIGGVRELEFVRQAAKKISAEFFKVWPYNS